MTRKRILSAIQPTNDSLHVGNYLGAVRQWKEFQNDNDAFYCVADLHALTIETDPKAIRSRTLATAAQVIASGVKPERSTLFLQSHVPAHSQLSWIMECLTGFGEASRMTQFKDKSQKSGSDRTLVGLFTYPMLMAADILLYQTDFVPVGEDQRQHIELTRDLAGRFNSRFGDTFKLPEPYILKNVSKINDLQDPTSKMSKSSSSVQGVLDILDAPEVNAKKIKSAVTDTGREIKFDMKEKPGISNLLTIHSALSGKSISEVEGEFSGKGYGDFKSAVAEIFVEYFSPIRTRTLELLRQEDELLKILRDGATKANEVASVSLESAYTKVGLAR
jgi:tryptophanyl-tRNA synthetase